MSKERNITVCSYDIIRNGTHKLSSLYKYFQQIAGDDLDAVGVTYEALLEKGIVFVLVKMKTRFYEALHKNDEVFLQTCHRKVKGVSFIRDYVLTKNGRVVAETSSYWVLMDIKERRLCRPNVLDSELYEPKEICSFEIDDRFSFPEDAEKSSYSYNVAFSDIDENNHMNNTRYPDICMDAIGGIADNEYVSEVMIDYVSEAKLGESIELEFNELPIDGKYYFSARNSSTEKRCFDTVITVSSAQE